MSTRSEKLADVLDAISRYTRLLSNNSRSVRWDRAPNDFAPHWRDAAVTDAREELMSALGEAAEAIVSEIKSSRPVAPAWQMLASISHTDPILRTQLPITTPQLWGHLDEIFDDDALRVGRTLRVTRQKTSSVPPSLGQRVFVEVGGACTETACDACRNEMGIESLDLHATEKVLDVLKNGSTRSIVLVDRGARRQSLAALVTHARAIGLEVELRSSDVSKMRQVLRQVDPGALESLSLVLDLPPLRQIARDGRTRWSETDGRLAVELRSAALLADGFANRLGTLMLDSVVTRHNLHDIPEMARTLLESGVDPSIWKWRLKGFDPVAGSHGVPRDIGTGEWVPESHIESSAALARAAGFASASSRWAEDWRATAIGPTGLVRAVTREPSVVSMSFGPLLPGLADALTPERSSDPSDDQTSPGRYADKQFARSAVQALPPGVRSMLFEIGRWRERGFLSADDMLRYDLIYNDGRMTQSARLELAQAIQRDPNLAATMTADPQMDLLVRLAFWHGRFQNVGADPILKRCAGALEALGPRAWYRYTTTQESSMVMDAVVEAAADISPASALPSRITLALSDSARSISSRPRMTARPGAVDRLAARVVPLKSSAAGVLQASWDGGARDLTIVEMADADHDAFSYAGHAKSIGYDVTLETTYNSIACYAPSAAELGSETIDGHLPTPPVPKVLADAFSAVGCLRLTTSVDAADFVQTCRFAARLSSELPDLGVSIAIAVSRDQCHDRQQMQRISDLVSNSGILAGGSDMTLYVRPLASLSPARPSVKDLDRLTRFCRGRLNPFSPIQTVLPLPASDQPSYVIDASGIKVSSVQAALAPDSQMPPPARPDVCPPETSGKRLHVKTATRAIGSRPFSGLFHL